jgi:RNA recognition motif-containing protein
MWYTYVFQIVKVRLPKDDRDPGRLKGFGYVEFEERNDLKEALGMTDTVSRATVNALLLCYYVMGCFHNKVHIFNLKILSAMCLMDELVVLPEDTVI